MSLSTYYLEYDRHVARLRRRLRAYAPTSTTANDDNHEKINSWVSFSFPYSYRKEKETHELIFSWLSWLAVLLVGVYARRRQRRRKTTKTSRSMKFIFQLIGLPSHPIIFLQRTYLILDIHVMIRWHLLKQGIRWPVSRDHIAGSGLQLIVVTRFPKLTAVQELFF